MDIIQSIAGFLIGSMVFVLFAELLIYVPGYFIYCVLFTKSEHDPDNTRRPDPGSVRVAVVGILFWVVLAGGAYGAYRLAV
jgi:hypothetical protein